MKKLLSLLVLTGMVFGFTACDDDENPLSQEELQDAALTAAQTAVEALVTTDASATGVTKGTNFDWIDDIDVAAMAAGKLEEDVTTNISTNTTWTADKVYILRGRITVLDGATLTIEPGTLIKGDEELSGENAAVLMIAKGGKIDAEGTVTAPIVMTSTADDGTLTAADKGKWGGLVILGNAPVSAKTESPQIEGVPSTDTNGLYGGSSATDNSGVIKYVSIRHGGAIIDAAAGDEINGLTLGGVGSGTTVQYVEVFANSDDGIEFFGGTVNASWVKVDQVGDDALDVDQSYAGTVSNFWIVVNENSDEGLEIDGREGSLDDAFTLKDGTIEAVSGSVTCDFKSKAKGTVSNVNANGGKIKLSAAFDAETLEQEEDAAYNVAEGDLTFTGVNATFEVYTDFE